MKIMELYDIADSLEEMEDLDHEDRFKLVRFLQEIDSLHSYEDRENNVEINLQKIL